MEYLIKPNGFGLFAEKSSGQAMISSLTVAEVFEKRHDAVLRDIKNLDCSADFRLHNFVESSYKNSQNKKTAVLQHDERRICYSRFWLEW